MTSPLAEQCRARDGKGYPAYKDLIGWHDLGGIALGVDRVQPDPFAPPSRVRLRIPWSRGAIPEAALQGAARRRATRDYLARALREALGDESAVGISGGGQVVLDRTAVRFADSGIEFRATVALPARGRRIQGREAARLLTDALPRAAAAAVRPDPERLLEHAAVVEDQEALRAALEPAGLVAFVADGSRLARRSGVDDRPLQDALPFTTPAARRVTLSAPHAGEVTGMGLPVGITLIVGGGFHGKSTLLNALQEGIYDHCPGDGREQVVTHPEALKLRAEDGRAVHRVDLSPYINHLPRGQATDDFSTARASGSTSQAAAVQEAVEAGARVLLMDEDTSATNFLIRDRRMQALVAKGEEPITPLIDRIRSVYADLGCSVILVMGGSGDYFEAADVVLQLHAYEPRDVTEEARRIAAEDPCRRASEGSQSRVAPARRYLVAGSLADGEPRGRGGRFKAKGHEALQIGSDRIELGALEQLREADQVRTIALALEALDRATGEPDPVAYLRDVLQKADWTELAKAPDGDLAIVRPLEALAALNRVRQARWVRPAESN